MGRAVCVGVREVVCPYREVLLLGEHAISASAIPCSTCAVYLGVASTFPTLCANFPNTSGVSGSHQSRVLTVGGRLLWQ